MNNPTMKIKKWWSNLLKTNFVRHAMPFMILVIGGSFALKEFTELRYRYNRPNMFDEDQRKLEEKYLPKRRSNKEVLETELQKLKQVDLDDWHNVRIPRPWEEEEENKK